MGALLPLLATPSAAVGQSLPGGWADLASAAVVPLRNGPNEVDLDGDGRLDMVFVAWRENFNAHGYSVFTFYRSTQVAGAERWELLPFFGSTGETRDSFKTEEGADCLLADIQVLQSGGARAPVMVVIGRRDFGQSFADSAKVTFTVYEMAANPDSAFGWPAKYLQARRTIRSRRTYCDVEDAFRSELHIQADDHGQPRGAE
jgi:hypothetical protein